jgi:hypothetical protein
LGAPCSCLLGVDFVDNDKNCLDGGTHRDEDSIPALRTKIDANFSIMRRPDLQRSGGGIAMRWRWLVTLAAKDDHTMEGETAAWYRLPGSRWICQ